MIFASSSIDILLLCVPRCVEFVTSIKQIFNATISRLLFRGYSVGWMRADYVVTKCDLSEKKITFCHDPNRAANLLERERVTCRKKSKELRVKSPEEVLGYLPITAENLEKYNQLVENDPGYGTDGKIIHNVLSA